MLKATLLMISLLATLLTGSALAAETNAPASEPTQAASAEVLPDEITSLFNPDPIFKYGMKMGPCSVSVTCIGPYVISCSGQSVCYWKGDSSNPSNRGFVECDSVRTTCQLQAE